MAMPTYREIFKEKIRVAREEIERAEKLLDNDGDLWLGHYHLNEAKNTLDSSIELVLDVCRTAWDRVFENKTGRKY